VTAGPAPHSGSWSALHCRATGDAMKLTLPLPSRRFLLSWPGALATALFLTTLAGSARAQGQPEPLPGETRAGNVLFRVPDGWTRTVDEGRIVFVPADLTAGQRC